MLLEAATGSNPFLAATPSETMHRHLGRPAPRLAELRPSCSPFLDELIATLLATRPTDRLPDAATLAGALRRGEDSPWWRARSASGRTRWRRLGDGASAGARAPLGRDELLARVERRLDAAAEGRGGAVLLTGEAGLGKTTVAAEWARLASERGFEVLIGRAAPGSRLRSEGPVLEAIRERVEPERIETLLAEVGSAGPEIRRRYAALVAGGGPGGEAEADRRLLATGHVALLRALSRRRSVAVLIDDLHHASPDDVEELVLLAAGLAGHPVLLLATSRPGGGLAALDSAGPELAERWVLERLPDEVVARVVREAGHSGPASAELAELVRRADGNAYFALELARHLEQLSGSSPPEGLPETLARLLELRLRSLSEAQRALLDAACVQGAEFDAALLAATLDRPALDALQELTALERRRSAVRAEGRGFRFEHQLLHEAVAAALPPSLAEALHGRLVDALAERWSIDADAGGLAGLEGDAAVTAAEHLARAGRLLEAAAAARPALRHLLDRHRSDAARELGGLVFATVEPGPEHLEAALLHAEAHRGSGGGPEQERCAQRALALALEGGTRRQRVRAFIASRSARFERGDFPAALEAVEAALERETWVELEAWERAELRLGRGYCLRSLHRGSEALAGFREAFREARRSGDERLIDRCLRALGDGAFSLGRMVQARRLLAAHARRVPAERDPKGAVNCRFLLTLLDLRSGREAQALEHARAANEALEFGATPVDRAMAREAELVAFLGAGRVAAALAASERGLRELRSGATAAQRATALLNAALARLQAGELETARARIEEGLALARPLDALPLVAGALALLLDIGAIEVSPGERGDGSPDPDGLERVREELATLLERIGEPAQRASILMALGRPALGASRAPSEGQVRALEEAARLSERFGLGTPGPVPACYLALVGVRRPQEVAIPERGLRPVLAEARLLLALATGEGGTVARARGLPGR